MSQIKQNKAITLIALVITIVVLVIIAGVAINLGLGENGIVGKAKIAVDKYNQAAVNEQTEFSKYENGLEKIEQFENFGSKTSNAITYTVSYNKNGGSGTMENTIGNPITIAENTFTPPNKKLFLKWNTASDGTGTDFVPGTIINEDVTLYAIWITPLSDLLKEGDWVKYDTGVIEVGTNGIIKCRVLYNNETNGLQIISADKVATVTLGDYDFDKALVEYNDAIEILNGTKQRNGVTVGALKYLNTMYAYDARCVGSEPTVGENGMFTAKNNEIPGPITLAFTFNDSTSLNAKKTDTNFETDWAKMEKLGASSANIRNIGNEYWLASRWVHEFSSNDGFYLRHVNESGEKSDSGKIFCYVYNSDFGGLHNGCSVFAGLRPCFSLKSNIAITGGTGIENNEYTLGI